MDEHLPKALQRDQSIGKDIYCDSDPNEKRSLKEVKLDVRNLFEDKIRVEQERSIKIKNLSNS